MDLRTFLELAQRYSDLGAAVQTQLREAAQDAHAIEHQNPAALALAAERFLRPLLCVVSGRRPDVELHIDVRVLLDNIATVRTDAPEG